MFIFCLQCPETLAQHWVVNEFTLGCSISAEPILEKCSLSNEKGAETVSVNILSSETVIGTGALEATILENWT